MKQILFIFITFHISLLTIYPQSVTQEWVRRYDGAEHLNDIGEYIGLDKFANVFAAGNTQSSSHSGDIFVIKYNSSGTQLWSNIYNGPANDTDFAGGLCVDDSGNVYITGSSADTGTETDIVTIKYDYDGVLQWVSRYRGHSDINGTANGIALDSMGNIFVTGTMEIIPNGTDIITIKYNPQTGDTSWTSRFHETGSAGNYEERASSICIDTNGNTYVAGSSYGNNGPPYRDYLLIKYNSAGNLIWFRKYNGAGNNEDFIRRMCIAINNNVCVTGLSYENATGNNIITIKYDSSGAVKWLSTYTGTMNTIKQVNGIESDGALNVYIAGYVSVAHETDYLSIKYDTGGVQQWAEFYNGTGNSYDECYGMTIDDSTNIYITGISVNTNNGYDFATVKYNTSGAQQWVARYPGWPTTDGNPITADKNGNVYVTGANEESNTGLDAIMIKYSQPNGVINLSSKVPNEFRLYQNYPNPFNPTTKIKFDVPTPLNPPFAKGGTAKPGGFVRLTIYDVLGREVSVLVNNELTPGTYEAEWDGSNYPTGMYFYRLEVDGYTQTRKMVLLK